MPISAKQLNFCDISIDFDKFYHQNQNNLLSLLNEFIHISEFIPFSFYQKYYAHLGTTRDYTLESMLSALILKNLLSITITDLLITFLNFSSELCNFCRFLKIPHKSQFSRFKTAFLEDFHDLFNELVDITEDLSEKVNSFLSSILITDTTGSEFYVTENNPKFYQAQVKSKLVCKFPRYYFKRFVHEATYFFSIINSERLCCERLLTVSTKMVV